jgi:chromosomal replication initiator protein
MTDGAAVDQDVFAISFRQPASPVARVVRADDRPDSGERDEFLYGPENRLPAAVITQLGTDGRYSPIFLCGASGTGKSHLAHALASSHAGAVYMQAADFAREHSAAFTKSDSAAAVDESIDLGRWPSAQLFILEDLTELIGHAGAMDELTHLLDAFELREVPVLITSRLPLTEIKSLPADLRSRLAGGLIVTLATPAQQARTAILRRLASTRKTAIEPDAIQLLAKRLNVTAVELGSALIQLESTAAKNHPIDSGRVQAFLDARQLKSRPTLKQICAAVAKVYGVKSAALYGASRHRQIALARSVAIYLGRVMMGLSLQALGEHFGGRDHTTALHSFRNISRRIITDQQLSSVVTAIQQQLAPGSKIA